MGCSFSSIGDGRGRVMTTINLVGLLLMTGLRLIVIFRRRRRVDLDVNGRADKRLLASPRLGSPV